MPQQTPDVDPALGAGKKVLVVDDSQFIRVQLRKILERYQFEVAWAEDGAQAVAQYIELRPDLVLLDIVMPHVDGLVALERIKKIDERARVVMVSSAATRDKVIEAKKAGAQYFVVKPFTEASLIGKLAEILNQPES